MKPPVIRYSLPPRTGILSVTWDKDGVKAAGPAGGLRLNDSQRKIVDQLNGASEGLLASEMSKTLGTTHAGVLFLLKPLLENGIIERIALRGGGVLYYMPYKIAENLSPEVDAAKIAIEKETGKRVQDMSLTELYESSRNLDNQTKKVLLGWIFEGGWKR